MIVATIPMRNHCDMTTRVVDQCLAEPDVDLVIVFDNDSEDPCCHKWLANIATEERVQVIHHPGRDNFYGMWNRAWTETLHLAPDDEPAHLAILNNDIVMAPGTLATLSAALLQSDDDVWITYPDWKMAGIRPAEPLSLTKTTGTRNLGGMCGYCFMVDARIRIDHEVPAIDEQFELLCGDGDLIQQIQMRGGFAACVHGLPIAHTESSTQHDSANKGWTKKARQRDKMRRKAKYG